MNTPDSPTPKGFLVALVHKFTQGPLAFLFTVAALTLGLAAIILTPREEEPQIVVPMADVYVQFPGASSREVEMLVAAPLEKLLWQIDGVEHVYSVSRRGQAVVTVRFFVGEDRERSLVKLHNRIQAHMDQSPPGVSGWIVKSVEIDDVPIVTLALHSNKYDDSDLRRMGEEVVARLSAVPDISRTSITGGRPREMRVELDPQKAASRGLSLLEISEKVRAADSAVDSGSFSQNNQSFRVSSGPFLHDLSDLKNLVVGTYGTGPVYLRDVADLELGPAQSSTHTRIRFKPQSAGAEAKSEPAVSLAISKKRGTNAVAVAKAVHEKIAELKRDILPSGVEIAVTRDNGATADEKVSELLSSLFFAMISVVALLLFTLGWREGLIVALAVPISFALALFVNYIFGYTINRVTLFALILTLGLVVDDPITNVDNIQRHILRRVLDPLQATLFGVQEVLPPVIMSTLTIIVSFLPMFFITGMMGPYMGPMAINVPLTVTFSTLAALFVVPWASYHLLKNRRLKNEDQATTAHVKKNIFTRLYENLLSFFLDSKLKSFGLFALIFLLLLGSGLLVLFKKVPMKMLPFDNKNELQLVLDFPEGTTLESTDFAMQAFEKMALTHPQVTRVTSYSGTHSPMDFNGLVRHYYFRTEGHQADLRMELTHKDLRDEQSHEIALALRPKFEALAKHYGVKMFIVEPPPGPPVIATVTTEIYGEPSTPYRDLIKAGRKLESVFNNTAGMVDVDLSAEDPHDRVEFELDKEKAGLHGISTEAVTSTLALALGGATPATLHVDGERNPLIIRLQLSEQNRSGIHKLEQLFVKSSSGQLVPLHELGKFKTIEQDPAIYHKDLNPVVYVFSEMAGRAPGETVLELMSYHEQNPPPKDIHLVWDGEGEWDITLRVFVDLGLAFGAAMIGIYLLLIIQTGSFSLPLVIMSAIPLTAIGILPGFWLLNLFFTTPVGEYDNPVFFTATAMIGMIALGGIVVRNSIVLIEFVQDSVAQGSNLREAILSSGSARMRPILLTAATTAIGAWPITMDPVFSGLAWALIFGLFASTAFSLIVVPVFYNLAYGSRLSR